MKNTEKSLGKRIQTLRQRADLTQEQLAEKAELSLKHLGELERGRGNPTLGSLESLADALGLSLGELFDLDHERLSGPNLKKRLESLIENATEEERRVTYRILSALTQASKK